MQYSQARIRRGGKTRKGRRMGKRGGDWEAFKRGFTQAFQSPQDFARIVGNEVLNNNSDLHQKVIPAAKQIAETVKGLAGQGRRRGRKSRKHSKRR